MNIRINGKSLGQPGGYDQLSVSGNVDLTGVNLARSSGTYTPKAATSDRFTVVANVLDTVPKGTTTGPFTGKPEGTIFNPNVGSLTTDLQITYVGGNGNDVDIIAANHANAFGEQLHGNYRRRHGEQRRSVSTLISGKFNDADAGSPSGIAITAVNNSTGTWQYSTDNGSHWTTFGTAGIPSARPRPCCCGRPTSCGSFPTATMARRPA